METHAAAHAGPLFYKLDGSKVSMTEARWDGGPVLAVPLWCLSKLIGRAGTGSTDDPAVESLEHFVVSPEEFPAASAEQLAGISSELAALGFVPQVHQVINDVSQRTRTSLISYSHPTLPIVARAHLREWSIKTPPKVKVFAEFITAFPDGTFAWSQSGVPDMTWPATCIMVHKPGASVAELLREHQNSLAAAGTTHTALRAATPEQVREITERLHVAVRDHHLARGIFRTPTAAEQADLDTFWTRRAEIVGSRHEAELAALDRLQNRKTSWGSAALILILSIIAFLVIGLGGSSSIWQVAALIPILLFHESGHYVAMKVFGYRNLRMFFIPGFGAAVSGRHTNIAGWKKGIVALMGPVPGILLGIVLGIVGYAVGSKTTLQASFLLLIINGFNLIPILPFDGGRVLHTVLFCRSPILDVVFRFLAAMGVFSLQLILKSPVLIAVGVMMLLGLPAALREARAAAKIRAEGWAGLGTDDPMIPIPIAERILDELKQPSAPGTKPKAQLPAALANQTLSVFETLNTRPPGWFASTLLLGTHVLSFVAAAFFAILVILARDGSLQRLVHTGSLMPRHQLTAPPEQAGPRPASGQAAAVVATYPTEELAKQAFADAKRSLGKDQHAGLIGSTLVIRVSKSDKAAADAWLTRLHAADAKAFAESPAVGATYEVLAVFKVQATAERLQEELESYFRLPADFDANPPWSGTPITPEQARVRRTLSAVRDAEFPSWNAPELEPAREQLKLARSAKDPAAVELATQKLEDGERQLAFRQIDAIAQSNTDLDHSLIARYRELRSTKSEFEATGILMREASATVGTRDPADSRAIAALDGGCADTTPFSVRTYIRFQDAFEGPEAFTNWLRQRGATHIYYSVSAEELEEPEPPAVPTNGTPPDALPGNK